jgi:hypothetical protein
MHPILLIVVLWLSVGVASFLTAVVLHTLLPIGPFLSAGIALVVGMSVVFFGFLAGRERTFRRRGE